MVMSAELHDRTVAAFHTFLWSICMPRYNQPGICYSGLPSSPCKEGLSSLSADYPTLGIANLQASKRNDQASRQDVDAMANRCLAGLCKPRVPAVGHQERMQKLDPPGFHPTGRTEMRRREEATRERK